MTSLLAFECLHGFITIIVPFPKFAGYSCSNRYPYGRGFPFAALLHRSVLVFLYCFIAKRSAFPKLLFHSTVQIEYINLNNNVYLTYKDCIESGDTCNLSNAAIVEKRLISWSHRSLKEQPYELNSSKTRTATKYKNILDIWSYRLLDTKSWLRCSVRTYGKFFMQCWHFVFNPISTCLFRSLIAIFQDTFVPMLIVHCQRKLQALKDQKESSVISIL